MITCLSVADVFKASVSAVPTGHSGSRSKDLLRRNAALNGIYTPNEQIHFNGADAPAAGGIKLAARGVTLFTDG
jgi:hypothetical protein